MGVGYAPLAPGTFGSALGVLAFLPFLALPFWTFVATWVGLTALGTWAAGATQEITGVPDDGRIVVDEISGQLLTLSPLLLLPEVGLLTLVFFLVTGFVAFRVLDIWKPGPVGWAERSLAGGVGVMADDVVAGAIGALLLGGCLAAGGQLGAQVGWFAGAALGGPLLA
ncbi:MAG: phosphatidylglycerophosphatase A [Myxococcota bacterium]